MRVWIAVVIAACGIGCALALLAVESVIVFELGGKLRHARIDALILQFLLVFVPTSVATGIVLALTVLAVRGIRTLVRRGRRAGGQISS
jgi:hypothetical protein